MIFKLFSLVAVSTFYLTKGSTVVKQWSIGGKLAFLGAMQDECLKDYNTCPDGFAVSTWIRTATLPSSSASIINAKNNNQQKPLFSSDADSRNIGAYLVSNGGQSPNSNGFYVRRMVDFEEYEIGVAYHSKIWRLYVYLKPEKLVHLVFTWEEKDGLKVYVDGLLASSQIEPLKREYFGYVNETGDPHPHFVANGDSLLFKHLFDEKTFLPIRDADFTDAGHVINVTYYHEWKSELEIGLMTLDYDDRLVASCFFEIPFGGELMSTLNNFTSEGLTKDQEIRLVYFKCRNDCVAKKSPAEPWTSWLAIVDPRTYNCFCLLTELYPADSPHKLDGSNCQNSFKQTKAQFSSVAMARPLISNIKAVDLTERMGAGMTRIFSLMVPSMKCFFVISGSFATYDKAQQACKRRGATLASMKSEIDEAYVHSQINWATMVNERGRAAYQRLLWVESRSSANENTCNFCADLDENCIFLTNNHKGKCDCQCVDSKATNQTNSVGNAVGVLCEKVAFDLPSDPAASKSFCGVPAVSLDSVNAFIATGETLKTFYVVPGKMSWDDAQEVCQRSKMGGALASIRSPEENNAVQRELHEMWSLRSGTESEPKDLFEPVWIGARRIAPHRPNFVWLDGTPVVFTAWVVGEPNNAIEKSVPEGLKGEECVGIWPNWSSGNTLRGWNDFNCFENRTLNFGALCEAF